MRSAKTLSFALSLVAFASLVACGGKSVAGGSGGAPAAGDGSGGQAPVGSGGTTTTTGSGGVTGSGGTTTAASGGATGSGGATMVGSGGTTASGSGGTSGGDSTASFEPMEVGATWSYNTSDPGNDGGAAVAGTKVVTVEAKEAVPGLSNVMAWRIHTTVPNSQDQLTWQDEIAAGIVRYRDDVYAAGGTTKLMSFDIYVPYKIRLDLTHLTTGSQSTQTYADTSGDGVTTDPTSTADNTDTWSVFAASESITVPAGTFTAIHIQKLNTDGSKVDKDYWFSRGVGKVKEDDVKSGRTEVLSSYKLP